MERHPYCTTCNVMLTLVPHQLNSAAMEKAKAEIAQSVLGAVSDPIDAEEIEHQILDEIRSYDWSAAIADKAIA